MPNVQCSLRERWKCSDDCCSLSSMSYWWFHDYFRSKGEAFDFDKLIYYKTCKNRLYSIKSQSGILTNSIIEHLVAENDPMEIDRDDEKLCLENWKYVKVKSNCCIICNLQT